MQRRRRTNYLNNRDLLLEIHKSKKTYCKYRKPQDSDFDIITDDVKKVSCMTILFNEIKNHEYGDTYAMNWLTD